MNTITESEKKRLKSLREKKQAFKTRGELIRQALNNLNTKNNTKNKKIVFDYDDVVQEQNSKIERKKKLILFHNNDNEEKSLWNDDEFSVDKNKNKKTLLGNDARFILDNRFMEDNHKTEETKNTEDIGDYDLQKEKQRQLDILENILGTPLTTKNQEVKPAKKGVMIRYDPTENGHYQYEIKSEAKMKLEIKEKDVKKKRHDKPVSEIKESTPVEVSKDIYYTVSNTLTENLKQKEEFSLLKVHGREDDTNVKDCDTSTVQYNKQQIFMFNFNAKNAFKYDSSDNEDIVNETDLDKQMIDETEDIKYTNNLFEHKDTLFFDDNDIRFNEAVRFFNQEALSNDEFKNLRRELKTIVRTKIRKNEKRQQPWGRKKIKKS